jgi:hypothetical protein
MNCQTYIFKLSSGQLEEAGTVERLWATQHRLMCGKCRAFTKNDAQLTRIMAEHQQRAWAPESGEAPPPSRTDAAGD